MELTSRRTSSDSESSSVGALECVMWPRRRIGLALSLAALLLLSGCVKGLEAQVDLKTIIKGLGWGKHQMVLAVPGEFSSEEVFDRLPDFSLITGVRVQDYRTQDWQGMEVTQRFYRLGKLNQAEKAHFLNRHYPGRPITFQADWQQGFFTRDLQVRILVNTTRSNALLEALSSLSSGILDTTYTLEVPGHVIHHNGTLLNEQTVSWQLDPTMPQTLEVTSRIVDVPLIASLVFTLASIGLAFYVETRHTDSASWTVVEKPSPRRLGPDRGRSLSREPRRSSRKPRRRG